MKKEKKAVDNSDKKRKLQGKNLEVKTPEGNVIGSIALIDCMGDDQTVVHAARVSYGKSVRFFGDIPEEKQLFILGELGYSEGELNPDSTEWGGPEKKVRINQDVVKYYLENEKSADRHLLRYLMRSRHTSPFEMCELIFRVRCSMDTWRQWIRHRTANVNEYSTRYAPAIDEMMQTDAKEWRLQAKNNKQGSGGFLPDKWEDLGGGWSHGRMGGAGYVIRTPSGEVIPSSKDETPGQYLTKREKMVHELSDIVYRERLDSFGIAKEQARKDLPLSNMTEAWWKIDLHNLFHFLGLRNDSHAQSEIRLFAETIQDQVIKKLFPVCYEAFIDYRKQGMFLSRLDIAAVGMLSDIAPLSEKNALGILKTVCSDWSSTKSRERDECVSKLKKLGLILD